jgi:hypothetical protein
MMPRNRVFAAIKRAFERRFPAMCCMRCVVCNRSCNSGAEAVDRLVCTENLNADVMMMEPAEEGM